MSALAFRYKGYGRDGRKVEGELTASSLEEAERKAVSQDIVIVSIFPAKASSESARTESGPKGATSRKRVSDVDSAAILKNLGVMVEAGVPFLEAIDSVVATAVPPVSIYLAQVRKEIVEGKGLSQAMRSVPRLFPGLVADMVKVAEEGGRLDQALYSASAYLQRAADLRRKVIQAMIYPIVMLSVSAMTVLILIIFVMPRFGSIFKSMKVDLPFMTRLLLSTGEIVRGHPIPALVAAVGFVVGVVVSLRNPVARAFMGGVMTKMPVIGDLMKRLALSRSMMSMATLLKANVSLLSALEHGSRMAGHQKVGRALEEARDLVEQGAPLSDSLEKSKVFPPMLIQMMRVGERTGRLHALLGAAAERLEEEADAKLKTMVALVEPVMIVFMGAIVGTITVSIISPIYSVVENVK